ncbi:hypothetical protein JYU34_004246 [Plutella xylostella]|uniref:Uncharacterized protein n=1 Tax=Plutella xylostella TaxID=51655 RepID=A0ABQ7QXI0_PLUXY|nr:hypothetical protein JYU34_004246 [Plutella xylostella]
MSVVTVDATQRPPLSRLYLSCAIPPRLPLVELLYCACQGLLFHARVMHEDACTKYIVNLMHTVTQAK